MDPALPTPEKKSPLPLIRSISAILSLVTGITGDVICYKQFVFWYGYHEDDIYSASYLFLIFGLILGIFGTIHGKRLGHWFGGFGIAVSIAGFLWMLLDAWGTSMSM